MGKVFPGGSVDDIRAFFATVTDEADQERLLAYTQELVLGNRARIVRLAKVLLRDRTIAGEELKALLV